MGDTVLRVVPVELDVKELLSDALIFKLSPAFLLQMNGFVSFFSLLFPTDCHPV